MIAAAEISANLGYENSIAFDMGGTTAKASLVHGREPSVAEGYYIGGYADGHPAMMPVVDIVEVGAGGGSIAWIDEVGALKVGPRSAGAAPGPDLLSAAAAPSRRSPTPMSFSDGSASTASSAVKCRSTAMRRMRPRQRSSASRSVSMPSRSRSSIVEIAVAKMSLAVRGVSVERGYDPRDFVMVGFGGAGPIHAAAIARELHIPTVIIPGCRRISRRSAC